MKIIYTLLRVLVLIQIVHCKVHRTGNCGGSRRCCMGYMWNKHEAKCIRCNIGFIGEQCNVPCPFPSYGEECQKICDCDEHHCHPSTGCEKCDIGYKGYNCRNSCPYPTYGLECQATCNCNKSQCHHQYGCMTIVSTAQVEVRKREVEGERDYSRIGRCCTGYAWDAQLGSCKKCDIGYLGAYCKERCPFPTFGFECQNTCECKREECDHAYGCLLQDVCTKGFFGPKCEQICPYPTYGQDCQVVCNCTEELCDPIEGCKEQNIFTEIISKESATIHGHHPGNKSNAPLNSTDAYQQIQEDGVLNKNRSFIITIVIINIIFIIFMTIVCIIFIFQLRRKRINNYQTQIAYLRSTATSKCVPKSSSASFSNEKMMVVREQSEYNSETIERTDEHATPKEDTEASLPFADQDPYLTPHNKDANSVYLTVIHT